MTRGDRAFVDTNVLLSATAESRPDHVACRRLFRLAPKAGVHLVSIPQVFREYLVVATRPQENNGLGMTGNDALHNILAFRARIHVLDETVDVLAEFMDLAGQLEIAGKRLHDANLVAAMRTHNVRILITANHTDFKAFDGIDVLQPGDAVADLTESEAE